MLRLDALFVFDRDRVDAVPLVGDGEAFVFKNMAQVAVARVAHDLDAAHAQRVVDLGLDAARVALVERRPAKTCEKRASVSLVGSFREAVTELKAEKRGRARRTNRSQS